MDMTGTGRNRRRALILWACTLIGLAVGVLLGYREIALISEGLAIAAPEDPRDGLTFIFYGFVFIGGVAGLGSGWVTGALVDRKSRKGSR